MNTKRFIEFSLNLKTVSLAITSDQMFIDSYHSFLSDVEAFFGWIAQEDLKKNEEKKTGVTGLYRVFEINFKAEPV